MDDFQELVFARRCGNDFTYALQYKPQQRSVILSGGTRWQKELETYRLSFPYLIFVINFRGEHYDRVAVTLRNEPLRSLDDKIYRVPMSNIYWEPDGLGVCMCVDERLIGTVADCCRKVVEYFWFTKFGNITPYIKNPGLDERVKNYDVWEHHSKLKPSFVHTVKWSDPKYTIRQLMRRLSGHSDGRVGYRPYDNFDNYDYDKHLPARYHLGPLLR